MYVDLHVNWKDKHQAWQLINTARKLGYAGLTFATDASKFQELGPSHEGVHGLHDLRPHLLQGDQEPPFALFSRADFPMSSTSDPIPQTQAHILGVHPKNLEAFGFCCEEVPCDLIVLPLDKPLEFPLKRAHISAALKRGILFEVPFSTAFLTSASLQTLIRQVHDLSILTKNRGILLTSGADNSFDLRSPEEFGTVCRHLYASTGKQEDKLRDPSHVMGDMPRLCLEHGRLRRSANGFSLNL